MGIKERARKIEKMKQTLLHFIASITITAAGIASPTHGPEAPRTTQAISQETETIAELCEKIIASRTRTKPFNSESISIEKKGTFLDVMGLRTNYYNFFGYVIRRKEEEKEYELKLFLDRYTLADYRDCASRYARPSSDLYNNSDYSILGTYFQETTLQGVFIACDNGSNGLKTGNPVHAQWFTLGDYILDEPSGLLVFSEDSPKRRSEATSMYLKKLALFRQALEKHLKKISP